MNKKCKRCNMKTILSKSDVERMVAQVKSMKGVRLADADTYSGRIKKCLECAKLEYGTTCIMCGCVVQVRAQLADGVCPYPGGGKW